MPSCVSTLCNCLGSCFLHFWGRVCFLVGHDYLLLFSLGHFFFLTGSWKEWWLLFHYFCLLLFHHYLRPTKSHMTSLSFSLSVSLSPSPLPFTIYEKIILVLSLYPEIETLYLCPYQENVLNPLAAMIIYFEQTTQYIM